MLGLQQEKNLILQETRRKLPQSQALREIRFLSVISFEVFVVFELELPMNLQCR